MRRIDGASLSRSCRGAGSEATVGRDKESCLAGATVDTNAARAIVRAGFVCGAAFVTASAIRGCVHGVDWTQDLLWTTVFGGSALLLLAAAGSLGSRVLLRSRLPGEIARGNLAAGVAAGAHFPATGL